MSLDVVQASQQQAVPRAYCRTDRTPASACEAAPRSARTVHPGQAGFTLIELLATLALAGVLLAAVMQVTTGVGRLRSTMEQMPGESPWRRQAMTLLRQDLAQAQSLDVHPDHLVLSGPLWLDEQTLAATHEPARVRYELVRREPANIRSAGPASDATPLSSAVLVRRQLDLLDRTNRPTRTHLLAMGVQAMAFEVMTNEREPAETMGDERRQPQLWVRLALEAEPAIEEIFPLP